MLPNFLIIGAQKAATTWLAKCLGEHPQIFMAPAKEIHYFNHEFDRGIEWYKGYFSDYADQKWIGEATPGYISYPKTPGRIKEVLGSDVKFIATLRHPVDRAYSAYWHYVSRGDIPSEIDFLTAFYHGDQFDITRFGLHDRGAYAAHLERYFQHFPRENFLIFIYEEAMKDKAQMVHDCFTFLGADPQFRPATLTERVNHSRDLKRFHNQALALRENAARTIHKLPPHVREPILNFGRRAFEQFVYNRLPTKNDFVPLTPALRQKLLGDFTDDIQQLEQLLGRDLSIWTQPVTAPEPQSVQL